MDEGTERVGRWIVAGIVAGLIVVAVAFGAYKIGYNRGQDHAKAVSPATTPTPSRTTTQTGITTTSASTTVAATPALVARGKQLYTADGCSGCHSLSGAAGAGPTFKGLAGSTVELTTGGSVPAGDGYLAESITSPDAQIVKGYKAGLMTAAVSGFGLSGKPQDVRALVAFIKAQK